MKTVQLPTLPEREKDDGLDRQKLHLWVICTEQFFGGDVEEEQSVQSQRDANVVDYRYVQVAMMRPASISITTSDH